jgi:hypothetical protein
MRRTRGITRSDRRPRKVSRRAGQAGHLQAEDGTDLRQAHPTDQVFEPRTVIGGSGLTGVAVVLTLKTTLRSPPPPAGSSPGLSEQPVPLGQSCQLSVNVERERLVEAHVLIVGRRYEGQELLVHLAP